jgi:hypothetical protein
VLSVTTLVMPDFLVATVGPTLSRAQLVFVGTISLVRYLVYVFVRVGLLGAALVATSRWGRRWRASG